MPAPILATKLYVPAPRPRTVLRARLVERLNAGLSTRVTLISASAGFGKTTLAGEWLVGCGRPAAWLSLDAGDSEPDRFLAYLIAALQTIQAGFGAGLLAALDSPQPPPIEGLLTTLLNEISKIPAGFILVLDDYHVIDSRAVDQVLAYLVEHQPPHMHLVIITREDPPLPLARLRVRGQLTELRTADLRFTPQEAADFLTGVMGLDLSAQDVTALEGRTEGWIAGLQMAALALQGLAPGQAQSGASSFIQSFAGSHHFVLDYLLEEVLHRQPGQVQAFLLRTAILEQMCGPLCDAVCSDERAADGQETGGQETLEYLERANLFIVPLDHERRWYRYHHLFGDLLRKRLGQSLPAGEIAGLHIRASRWYEARGMGLEAFQHAVAANDVDRAGLLIESGGMPLHYPSVAAVVLDWLLSLPATVKDDRPVLWVKSATTALVAGQTSGVEERLQSAENALLALEPDARHRDLLGQVAAARATLALTRYQPDTMIDQAQRALEYLHPDNLAFRFTASWILASAYLMQGDRAAAARANQESVVISQQCGNPFNTILALSNLGELQFMENQLFQAAETYSSILPLFGDHPQPNATQAHIGLAQIYYEWNDLDAAEQYGQKSLHLAQLYDRVIDRFIISELFLARLRLAHGDVDGAAEIAARADESARQRNFILRMPEVAAMQVLVLLRRAALLERSDRPDERQRALVSADRLARSYDLPEIQARVLLARGEPLAALEGLEALRRQMEARGWADERLKAMVLQAVALQACSEQERAVDVLLEALALAEPGGMIRLFVDEGPVMAQLLHAAAGRGVMAGYIQKLLAAFDRPAETAPAPGGALALVEPLSQRELAILRLIADGLSNAEISKRLFLAIDTIKGHNRRIFDKLQVQRRTEAIARARELGLL